MGRPPVDIAMNVHLVGDHPHVIIAPTAHRLNRARLEVPVSRSAAGGLNSDGKMPFPI
jgi:hypothetical protein